MCKIKLHILNSEVLTPNILARTSEDGLLPYCEIGATWMGYSQLDLIVRSFSF